MKMRELFFMLREDLSMPQSGHHVSVEDCRRFTATGVSEVMSFDEQQVVMDTDHGVLTVEGSGLHVEKLSLDIGELAIAGTINALYYARRKQSRGSLWSKLF